jgi:hypothetical protein
MMDGRGYRSSIEVTRRSVEQAEPLDGEEA